MDRETVVPADEESARSKSFMKPQCGGKRRWVGKKNAEKTSRSVLLAH